MTSDNISALPGITTIAPTICELMGVSSSDCHGAAPLPAIVAAARSLGGPVERCLIVAGDAIGVEQLTRYPDVAESLSREAPEAVTLRAMSPSVTPVCYGSMFSGATPDTHGIKAYAKPVLTVGTLFDVLPAAGKRVAIVAVPGCSMDKIFRERPIDYFIEPDDAGVLDRALRLIAGDAYDCLFAYLPAYDSELHRSTPWSDEAIAAMRQVASHFGQLSAAIDEPPWRGFNRAIHFAPDHGAHTGDNGKGTHGSDLPDDMIVRHYFGFRPADAGLAIRKSPPR